MKTNEHVQYVVLLLHTPNLPCIFKHWCTLSTFHLASLFSIPCLPSHSFALHCLLLPSKKFILKPNQKCWQNPPGKSALFYMILCVCIKFTPYLQQAFQSNASITFSPNVFDFKWYVKNSMKICMWKSSHKYFIRRKEIFKQIQNLYY